MPITCSISAVCAKKGDLFQIDNYLVSDSTYVEHENPNNFFLNFMLRKLLEKHPNIELEMSDDSIGFSLSAWGNVVTDRESYQERLEQALADLT